MGAVGFEGAAGEVDPGGVACGRERGAIGVADDKGAAVVEVERVSGAGMCAQNKAVEGEGAAGADVYGGAGTSDIGWIGRVKRGGATVLDIEGAAAHPEHPV